MDNKRELFRSVTNIGRSSACQSSVAVVLINNHPEIFIGKMCVAVIYFNFEYRTRCPTFV